MIDGQSGNSARRTMTLVVRAFVSEDGVHYGILSDPGAANGWQVQFSSYGELVNLLLQRLATTSSAARDQFHGDPGLHDNS